MQITAPGGGADATKLPLAGGTMTGPLTLGSGAKIIGDTGLDTILDCVSGQKTSLRHNNSEKAYANGSGFFAPVLGTGSIYPNSGSNVDLVGTSLSFISSASNPAGSGTWLNKDSSGNLNANCATAASHILHINGSPVFYASGAYVQNNQPLLINASRYTGNLAQLYGATDVTLEAATTGRAALTAGGAPASTIPGYHVYGASHANSGSLVSRAGRKSHAADGTWRDHLDLSTVRGASAGVLITGNDGTVSWYTLNAAGDTLTHLANWGANYWVNSGSAASGNKSLRVSGGKIQVYIGSGTGATELSMQIFE